MIDILGDLFQGAITYGEAGQFLSPQPLCRAMAQMTINDFEEPNETPPPNETDNPPPLEWPARRTVCDPACGSGRMLLAVAEINRSWEFVGQDVDLRCVRLTALNLAFRGLYGYVIWGNSLKMEKRLVYRTGLGLRGFIREVPLAECPVPVREMTVEVPTPRGESEQDDLTSTISVLSMPKIQLKLF